MLQCGAVHYVFRSIVALHSFRLKLCSVKCIVQCSAGAMYNNAMQYSAVQFRRTILQCSAADSSGGEQRSVTCVSLFRWQCHYLGHRSSWGKSALLTLHCTRLHCTASHCTALHCTASHRTAPHCTALHCSALHCTALHCTELHCTVLHCTALRSNPGAKCNCMNHLRHTWWHRWVRRAGYPPLQCGEMSPSG